VRSEAEAAALREVQKLGRRAVLFADDVSRTMHSFDAAFTQVSMHMWYSYVGYKQTDSLLQTVVTALLSF
jgi:hypothetical protein